MNSRAADLYLTLMKRCLLNLIYEDPAYVECLNAQGHHFPYDPDWRLKGKEIPTRAHTMIGEKRLDNLRESVETLLTEGIPGDLLEAGVWRGGASIFMRALLKVHGVENRLVWAADSFQGLPEPELEKYPQDSEFVGLRLAELAVSLDEVRRNFDRYGLLDDQVRFLPGWFRETLPEASIGKLALLRLDGDMYESTQTTLTHLYPLLSPGGFVIVDDYGSFRACAQAVDEFRQEQAITVPLHSIDFSGVCWRKA